MNSVPTERDFGLTGVLTLGGALHRDRLAPKSCSLDRVSAATNGGDFLTTSPAANRRTAEMKILCAHVKRAWDATGNDAR